jgi:hypothetical protein
MTALVGPGKAPSADRCRGAFRPAPGSIDHGTISGSPKEHASGDRPADPEGEVGSCVGHPAVPNRPQNRFWTHTPRSNRRFAARQ